MENKKTNLLITLILAIAMVSASVFISFDQRSVSAETDAPAEEQVEQIEELTLSPDKDAKYDGYIVKIEDGKENKVDENAVEDYESTKDNDFVVVEEPTDTLDFVEPEYVEYIEPNYMRYSMETEKYTLSKEQAQERSPSAATTVLNKNAYDKINVKAAWDKGYDGDGVNVAVLDTGLNTKTGQLHVALDSSKIKNTYNFIKTYPYGYRKSGKEVLYDDHGHGTFVAGLIGAQDDTYLDSKGNEYTFKGIANQSNFYIGKVLSTNEGSVGDFIIGLQTLTTYNKKNPSNKIDVVNMSLGGAGFSNAEYSAILGLTKSGTVAIAAAGNEGEIGSALNYPANYPNVIGVGSVDNNGAVSSFSSRNSSVLVAAPGNSLYSLSNYGTDALEIMSGTSMSSPIVAGSMAMLREIDDDITQNQILTLIKQTSNKSDGKNNKNSYDINTGYGILDVEDMTNVAKSSAAANSIPYSYQVSYRTEKCKVSGRIPTIHTSGTATTLPTSVTKKGYTFSQWRDQNGVLRKSIPANYKGDDLVLKPVWIAKHYKLKFKGNGGKVKASSKAVTYNKAIGSLKAPKKRSGYNFIGWYTKKSGGTQYYKGKKYKKAGNKTLYAHWTKKRVVKFKANKGSVKKYAKTISKGEKYGSLPKPTRSGYKFKGWYTKKSGGKKVTKNSKVSKSGNVTIYAHWKKK